MKREWIRPLTEVQSFVANEYCSSCGDTEYGKYLFTCDAPGGRLYYYNERGKAQYIGKYSPCEKKHEADMASEFPDGFIDYNRNGREDSGEAVIVWIERGMWGSIANAHATTNLNQDSWEIVKS